MESPTAVLVIVGDEILSGHTKDTNSHWLAQRMRTRGIRLLRVETIPDDPADIDATLRRLLARDAPTWVVVVGGLGPTPDDRTYEGIARALGVPLEVRPEHVAWLRDRVARHGLEREPWADLERSEAMVRMIRLPSGSQALSNPVGAALGCVAVHSGSRVVALPGVPAELYAMFDESLVPHHMREPGVADEVREVEVWAAEASLWDALVAVERAHPRVRLGSYPQDNRGRVILRLTGPAPEVALAFEDLHARTRAVQRPKA